MIYLAILIHSCTIQKMEL